MTKKFLWNTAGLLLLAVLIEGPVRAQVNIEKIRGSVAEEGFTTSAHFLFSTRSGNVDITQLALQTRTDYTTGQTTTFLMLRGVYGWQDGEPFSNEGLAHLRHVFRGREWIHPEGFVQIDYDKARSLTFRSLGGAGLRFNVFRDEKTRLSLGSAYMLEHERFDLPPESLHSQKNTNHRWSNYVSLSVAFSDDITLTWTSYVQPRFDDFSDLKTVGEGGFEFDVNDLLTLTATARLRYDSAPPDGVMKRDTSLLTGFLTDF